jgi:hypothetical protein
MIRFMGREDGEDYRSDFLIMLNAWEGAVRFFPNALGKTTNPFDIAALLGWSTIAPAIRHRYPGPDLRGWVSRLEQHSCRPATRHCSLAPGRPRRPRHHSRPAMGYRPPDADNITDGDDSRSPTSNMRTPLGSSNSGSHALPLSPAPTPLPLGLIAARGHASIAALVLTTCILLAFAWLRASSPSSRRGRPWRRCVLQAGACRRRPVVCHAAAPSG